MSKRKTTRLSRAEQRVLTEVANSLNDITNPINYNGLLLNPDPTLAARAGHKGLALYDAVERDGHARAVLYKSKLMVATAKWDLLPASKKAKDVEAAKFVRSVLERISFARVRYDHMDSKLRGYAVGEVMWAIDGNQLTVEAVKPKDQRRFVFDHECKLRLLTRDSGMQGVPVPARKFIVHSYDAKYGNPYGSPTGAILFYLITFKKEGLKMWMEGGERFGFPSVLATHPANMNEEDAAKVLEAAEQVYSGSAAAVSEGVDIKLLESTRANDTSLHKELIAMLNDEISKAVLTQSATMGMGRHGSYAASETFAGFEKVMAQFECDMLDATYNDTLIKWLVDLNFPGAGYPKLTSELTDEAELMERAKRDGLITGLGFEAEEAYVQKTFGSHWKKVSKPESTDLPPAIAGNFKGNTPAERKLRGKSDEPASA